MIEKKSEADNERRIECKEYLKGDGSNNLEDVFGNVMVMNKEMGW